MSIVQNIELQILVVNSWLQISQLTVPSARWWTAHGISTIDPTWAVMLVKFTVLKWVSSNTGCIVALINWFTLLVLLLFVVLRNLFPSLNLLDRFLNELVILLESLIEFGTVKLDVVITLSLSKVRVWFCSILFGIIKKPIEEAKKWVS